MPLKIVFMGTPEFALPSLRLLNDSHHSIATVVTGPDARSGRGRNLLPTPVKELASELGLQTLTPESLKSPEFIEQLKALAADAFVVIAFRILPRSVFSLPRLGSINLHGSLLPAYRGAAPIQRTLMDGAQKTGLSVFSLADKVDTGELILQKSMPILAEDNFSSLSSRMAAESGALLVEALDLMEAGAAKLIAQDSSLATSAPKITASDTLIDWGAKASSIVNQVRGLSETPGAYTGWRGKRLKVLGAKVCQLEKPLKIGEVSLAEKRICVGAGESSALELLALQPEGKKKMEAVDIINGQFLREGEVLGAC